MSNARDRLCHGGQRRAETRQISKTWRTFLGCEYASLQLVSYQSGNRCVLRPICCTRHECEHDRGRAIVPCNRANKREIAAIDLSEYRTLDFVASQTPVLVHLTEMPPRLLPDISKSANAVKDSTSCLVECRRKKLPSGRRVNVDRALFAARRSSVRREQAEIGIGQRSYDDDLPAPATH
jgi:hypothetical protein